jgi:hypothetical protein
MTDPMDYTESGIAEVLQQMTTCLSHLTHHAVFIDLSQVQRTILNRISYIFHTGNDPFNFITRFSEHVLQATFRSFTTLRHASTLVFVHSVGTVTYIFLIIDFAYPSSGPSPRRLNTILGLYYMQYISIETHTAHLHYCRTSLGIKAEF